MAGFWQAKWISYHQDPAYDLIPTRFERSFELDRTPEQFVIRVSADQRFKLYVNGHLTATGPQRGDLQHWFYDELDIAPLLKPGANKIEALVWSFGRYAPMAQISARLAFICEGPGVATPEGWTVRLEPGRTFEMTDWDGAQVYLVVGPSEIIRADMPLGEPKEPNIIGPGKEPGSGVGDLPWWLIPRTLPPFIPLPMGISHEPFVLNPGEEQLVDMGELVCGYPRLTLAGGTLVVGYAEALADESGVKGNRSETDGKLFHGYYDRFIGGAEEAEFETLWWRTFRFLMLRCPGPDPVRIERLEVLSTGSPFPVEASFSSSDPDTDQLWEVGIRTAQTCAGETYFDCPYYEQLQYAGDTRIQALLGYYLSADRARQRTAVDQFAWSRISDGLLQSRYPSRDLQVIPGFCLWWVQMLYDQWLYDTPPSAEHLHTAREQVRLWHERLLEQPERSYWTFADWCPEWQAGEPPGKSQALVHRLTLLLAEIALAKMTGENPAALANQLARFNLAKEPSEHAHALHALCAAELATPEPSPAPLTGRPIDVAGPKCTYYFAFYKHLAEARDDYMSQLGPWREQIALGLSTFAETPEPTRSDSHAWSAHPLIGFFQQIAGVRSIAPGWTRALIAPKPGSLTHFKAQIPHPQGEMRLEWDGGLKVECPVPFRLVWQGAEEELEAGSYQR